jgi:hypothetical protein
MKGYLWFAAIGALNLISLVFARSLTVLGPLLVIDLLLLVGWIERKYIRPELIRRATRR